MPSLMLDIALLIPSVSFPPMADGSNADAYLEMLFRVLSSLRSVGSRRQYVGNRVT